MEFSARTLSGIPVAVANGEIFKGDDQRFRDFISQHPERRVLILSSIGGDLQTGMEIGRKIRQEEMTTFVPKPLVCYSACFFMYIGGRERDVDEQGQLGVHQFYGATPNSQGDIVQSQTQSASAEVLNYILSMGAHVEAFEISLRTPPDQMHVFTRDELERFGLTGKAPLIVYSGPRSKDCPWPKNFQYHDPLGMNPGCE